MRSERVTKMHPSLSKDKVLSDFGHSMSIRNLILVVNSVTVSYLIHYDILLQNAINIITKCDRNLLQNASGFLSKNASFSTKCDGYYKLRQFITNCDSCYKMRRLLHIATVQTS